MRKPILILFAFMCTSITSAQVSRLGEDVKYEATLSGQFGNGDNTPFWQTANKYGLATNENNSGYLRAAIRRDTETDSLRRWRLGYGADLVLPIGYSSHFVVQQLYGELQYRGVRLSIGQKERPVEMKNQLLSSGGMTMGTNARPLPLVRLETPNFFYIPGTKKWVALKGHCAYGWYADNRWQRDFNAGNKAYIYNTNTLYHSKAGYMRIGNLDKFPLVFTGGVEMIAQFGGTIRNLKNSEGIIAESTPMRSGFKEYLKVFIPTGSDVTDGDNPNVMGNHMGSYMARLDYHGKGWMASVYGEHFFEDHSMMGWDFAWKDFLWGIEVNLPKNPIISTILVEHLRTTDQSGAVFKSMKSEHVPYAIGGVDDYYNHVIYGAYHHAGFTMGNPLLISPIYNSNSNIKCYDNRVTAHHAGISGNPTDEFSYRLLYTHEKSLGTYKSPRVSPAKEDMLMAEVSYHPKKVAGLGVTLSYGQDWGQLLGNNKGGMLTVSYNGVFSLKK